MKLQLHLGGFPIIGLLSVLADHEQVQKRLPWVAF